MKAKLKHAGVFFSRIAPDGFLSGDRVSLPPGHPVELFTLPCKQPAGRIGLKANWDNRQWFTWLDGYYLIGAAPSQLVIIAKDRIEDVCAL